MDAEALRTQIPHYLLSDPSSRNGFLEELRSFEVEKPFYTSKYNDEFIQGDCWTGLQVTSEQTAEKKLIKGIILSNTCDISPDNHRHLPVKIIFAPLVSLPNFEGRLVASGASENSVKARIDLVKQQRISDLFYLPKGGGLETNYIALLGDVNSVSSSNFQSQQSKEKLLTLSAFGHYLFLYKLSIHFCRFNEGINRAMSGQ